MKVGFHFLSCSPNGDYIAFAQSTTLRIWSEREQTFVDSEDLKNSQHTEVIRDIQFSTDGAFLVSCGDDKSVKVWDTKTWKCTFTRKVPKKPSTSTFGNPIPYPFKKSTESSSNEPTNTSNVVIYADKFGDIFFTPLNDSQQQTLLLGHCSIITQLKISPDGKFLISTDRDEKIRVSHYPDAYRIQSFCFGHTNFLTSVCFPTNAGDNVLVSGAADGTLKVWNFVEGKMLSTLHVIKDNNDAIISSLSYSPVNNHIAVVVESHPAMYIYSIENSTLTLVQTIELKSNDVVFSAAFDKLGALWAVGYSPLVQVYHYDNQSKTYKSVSNATTEKIAQTSVPEVTDNEYDTLLKSVQYARYKKKVKDENYLNNRNSKRNKNE